MASRSADKAVLMKTSTKCDGVIKRGINNNITRCWPTNVNCENVGNNQTQCFSHQNGQNARTKHLRFKLSQYLRQLRHRAAENLITITNYLSRLVYYNKIVPTRLCNVKQKALNYLSDDEICI